MVTTDLEKIISEIRQGKRTVLFPPGIFHLAFSIVFAMIGFVFFVGAATNIFAPDQPVPVVAVVQLSSLLFLMIGVVAPGGLILMGKKRFALWLRYFLFALFCLAAASMIYALFIGPANQILALLISLGFSGSAIWLSSRAEFLLLCEFFFLLKRPHR